MSIRHTDRRSEVTVSGTTFSYILRRSRRAKNLLLHVDITGHIEVVVPWHVAYRQAEQFVREKQSWLLRTVAKQSRLRQDIPVRVLRTGAGIPLQGQEYLLLHVHREPGRRRSSLRRHHQVVHVRVRQFSDVRRVLVRWYRKQAHTELSRYTHHYASRIKEEVTAVRISDFSSQWGSCLSDRKILAFSWRLMLAPVPVARYVVAHEVAHLKISNHSPAFWHFVGRLEPQYEEQRRWLRTHGHTLVL